MSKTLAILAMTFGFLAAAAGSAFAGCAYHDTQSVAVETQTASTGEQTPATPVPEDSSD